MIRDASSAQDIALARELFLEYGESLGFSLCFQGFDEELATLPGRYAPPGGAILLAFEDGLPAGCVALRALEPESRCEMKRMFVREAFRGRGLGRALAEAVITRARELGHREMVLDTLDTMIEATRLYRSVGFVDIAAYTFNPLPNAVFLGLRLHS